MAMGDPPPKRGRFEMALFYQINEEAVQVRPLLQTSLLIAEVADELPLTSGFIVKQGGEQLGLFTNIPSTSEMDPLIFITEVVIYVRREEGKIKTVVSRPTVTLENVLQATYEKEFTVNDNLPKYVAFLEGEVVGIKERMHTLFLKTTPSQHIHLSSSICVPVKIVYSTCTKKKDYSLEATSSILDIVEAVKSSIEVNGCTWRLKDKNIVVTNDDQKITDWNLPAVKFPLNAYKIGHMSCSVTEKVATLGAITSPASKYSFLSSKMVLEKSNKASDFCGITIYNHREGNIGHDITLYYSGFQTFMDECKNCKPNAEDCTFVMRLCNAMAQVYEAEENRHEALFNLLLSHVPGIQITVAKRGEGRCDILIGKKVYVEVKKEMESTNNDSFAECSSYYYQDLSCAPFLKCPVPAYILQIMGPNLIISGIVYGEHVLIDRLAPPLWLVPQPHNNGVMTEIAKVIKALKNAIYSLVSYYDILPEVKYPRFPMYQSYPDNGNKIPITYDCQLKNHLFYGHVGEEEVIIKFTETYCRDAHVCLESQGYAPKLYWCGTVSSRFQMVVMEFVHGNPLLDYMSQHRDQTSDIITMCNSALKCLHDQNLCHGDFRHTNILVRDSGKVCVLDYEWAGVVGQTRYPLYMNHEHITWPGGAADGELIMKDHDTYWVQQLAS